VEVESTTRSAKERVAGFEGREGHRTPFASVLMLQELVHVRNCVTRRNGLCYCCGAISNSGDRLVQVRNAEMRIPATHRKRFVSERFRDVSQLRSGLTESVGELGR
jgi:hypothetical protein